MDLYYQVCLAVSQILMKSSMHSWTILVCVHVFACLLWCLNFTAPFHDATCAMCTDACMLIAQIFMNPCDCIKSKWEKRTPKNYGLNISGSFFSHNFHLVFLIGIFGEEAERCIHLCDFFYYWLVVRASWITNLNPFLYWFGSFYKHIPFWHC